MRVHLGADHAGFPLKQRVAERLRAEGHDVVDHGAPSLDPADDYPPYCLRAAAAVAADPGSLGVVLGGSGNGEQIAANKVRGVRAALAWNEETARLARRHNDARVVAVGARMHSSEKALALVGAFLDAEYLGEERHARRVEMLDRYERTGELPPAPAG